MISPLGRGHKGGALSNSSGNSLDISWSREGSSSSCRGGCADNREAGASGGCKGTGGSCTGASSGGCSRGGGAGGRGSGALAHPRPVEMSPYSLRHYGA